MVTWGDVVEVDQGEAYQGPWRMNRSDFRYVDAPSVDLSDDGRMAVVWVDQARKDVLFQPDRHPQGLAHTTSADGGNSFSTPAPVPGTAGPNLGFSGGLQGLLMRKLAANPRGELAVVNSTFNPGERSRVRLISGRGTAP